MTAPQPERALGRGDLHFQDEDGVGSGGGQEEGSGSRQQWALSRSKPGLQAGRRWESGDNMGADPALLSPL